MNIQTQPLNYQPPVSQLLSLGEDAARGAEWFDYLSLGFTEADASELIRMVFDENLSWEKVESPAGWAPIHAWRTLGQLKAEAAIEPLLEMLPSIDEGDDWASEDFPEIYAQIGPAAIPILHKQLMDNPYNEWVEAALSNGLERIAKYHPDYRGECVAIITEKLRHHHDNDPTLNGFIISDLLDLRAIESVAEIEMAYNADNVDLTICGDWEDMQIKLGLLSERITPKPNYLLQSLGIDDAVDGLFEKAQALQAKTEKQKARILENKKVRRKKTKDKQKRKQAKAQRKKQRRKK